MSSCKLSVTRTICSDHDPINPELMHMSLSRKYFRFKFENMWLKESGFHEEVSAIWKGLPASHFFSKLVSVSMFMAKWGKEYFYINFETK